MAMVDRRTDAGTTAPPESTGSAWPARSSRRDPRRVERRRHGLAEFEHLAPQLIERQFGRSRPSADQPVAGCEIVLPNDHAQPTTKEIANDRWADRPADGERKVTFAGAGARQQRILELEIGTPQRLPSKADAFSTEADEDVTISNRIDQAERRARPLARRAFSTARPPRVLMRARKPCVLARRRAFG